jgi:hypothetical protein
MHAPPFAQYKAGAVNRPGLSFAGLLNKVMHFFFVP